VVVADRGKQVMIRVITGLWAHQTNFISDLILLPTQDRKASFT